MQMQDDETRVPERVVNPSSMVPGWHPDTFPDEHERAVGLEGVKRARAALFKQLKDDAADCGRP